MGNGIHSHSEGLIGKLLVANRGEIALRIIRSAKLLGIKTVALFVDQEKESAYVALANECISLGSGNLDETFLNIRRIIGIAITTHSTAIHPGYGFLSENPDFAKACEASNLIFIGPASAILQLTANKTESKRVAASLGIPVLRDLKIDLRQPLLLDGVEFPLLIKATYGGGGKGMQIVENANALRLHIESSARKAVAYFGDGSLFAEHYLRNARHVEVQLLGDQHGNLVHLFERECSIQRNHQKIIEEAPAQFLSDDLRDRILNASLLLGKFLRYTGAGTVEFLLDDSGNFFFIEMNPRIQVEHAVTEQITGIDIVEEQLKIASGLPLSFSQEMVKVNGHAMEARFYAENPSSGFVPSALKLLQVHLPNHHHLRIEADLLLGQPICSHFDPMLFKLISWGTNRNEALELLKGSISKINILGPENNASYLESILCHPNFQADKISVEFCQQNHQELIHPGWSMTNPVLTNALIGLTIAKTYLMDGDRKSNDPWHYTGYWRSTSRPFSIQIGDNIFKVRLNSKDRSHRSFLLNETVCDFELAGDTGKEVEVLTQNNGYHLSYHVVRSGEILAGWRNRQHRITLPELIKDSWENNMAPIQQTVQKGVEIISPLHGKVVEIFIKEKQRIKKGDPLLMIEAMKSENRILSHRDAVVKQIAVKVGAQVTDRMPLIFLEE